LGAALDLLLDGALDGVGGAQPATVMARQGHDGEAFGNVVLEPLGEARGALLVVSSQAVEFGLCVFDGGGVPDPAQLGADAPPDGRVGRVVDGVLGEVELAALSQGPREDGLARRPQPGMGRR